MAKTISGWWWLSFADKRLPGGQQFLGAAMVEGATLEEAIRDAWRLKINPGGEVLGMSLQDIEAPKAWRGRLLTREQAGEADRCLGIEIAKRRGPQ